MRETGFLDRTIRVAGVEYPFQVFVPAGLNSTRPHPVILFLHGIGECGDDGLRPTEVGLGTAIRRTGRRFPALVVFPQAPQGRNWTGTTAVLALRALDLAIAEFGGDPRRVYVTGLSMGGTGALRLAADHPGRFAAIAPICPTTPVPPAYSAIADEDTPVDADGGFAPPRLGRPPVPADRVDALARALARTPAWVFQGADDTDPTPSETRRLVAALDRISGRVRYTEYPGVGHNAWDRAYAEPGLLPWLLAQRREG